MAHVITSQPTSKSMEYTAVVADTVDGGLENMTIQDAENEEENQKKRDRASEECCCLIQETDPLYDYWCIRSIADLFVACGVCTESTCERCCLGLCDSGDPSRNHRNCCDGCDGCGGCCELDCKCCHDNCCEGDGCCDGDCGGCDCDCGGCDCDCGGCDCNF